VTGLRDTQRGEAARLEEMREEARYRRERLEVYRARLYGGRRSNMSRLRELQLSSDGAASRLRAAKAAASEAVRPTP
jgi:hypothetical protein